MRADSLQVVTLPATGVTATAATLNGDLIYAGPSNAVVTVFWGGSDGGTNAAALGEQPRARAAHGGRVQHEPQRTHGGDDLFLSLLRLERDFGGVGGAWRRTSPHPPRRRPASREFRPTARCGSNGRTPAPGSYEIKRSTTNGGPYATQLAGIVGTNFTDPTVVMGTTYYYVVNAVSGGAAGADSAQATVLPVAAPDGRGGVAEQCRGERDLERGGGCDELQRPKRASSGSGPFSVIQGNLVGTSFADTGLSNGTA